MKVELRKQLHALRNGLGEKLRLQYSATITDKVISLPTYKDAATVMGYMTFSSEFGTHSMARHALSKSKTLVLPRVNRAKHRLQLYQVTDLDRDLQAGPWGIPEPRVDICRETSLSEVDFILVPGLGFDALGHRLGYGAGFYDRLLEHREPHTFLAAAAFSVQMVESVPVDEHDVPVDVVITETATYERPRTDNQRAPGSGFA